MGGELAGLRRGCVQGWQMYSSSVTYLLQLWTRLVSCAAYLKSGQPNLLADLLPQIISAYVQCRLDSVQLVAQVRTTQLLDCRWRRHRDKHARIRTLSSGHHQTAGDSSIKQIETLCDADAMTAG